MSARARVGVIIGFLVIGTTILVGRIFQIAIVDHSDYIAKAHEQQQVERDVLPKRGSILIQNAAAGTTVTVAESLERFTLSAVPRNVVHKEEYATLLSSISGVDRSKLLAAFKKDNLYMEPFMSGLTKDDVSSIADKIVALEKTFNPKQGSVPVNFDETQGNVLQYLGGVLFLREYERTYPEGPLMGQLLGFVNDKGTGQYGFEGQFNDELEGYAGKVSLSRDSRGVALQISQQIEGKDGQSYELTIDRNVQATVEAELAKEVQQDEAKGGSVIIMDPKTGGIIAMASVPSYDPALFRQVAKDTPSVFDNPTISSIWEPGSIFKPLVMSAAIDQGLVTPDTASDFSENVVVNGYTINTALKKAYGHETMTDVLVNSDNVAMVWVGNKLGNTTMADYLQRFGFGAPTGVDLKNEIGGKVLPVEKWSDINRSTMTFGQGIAVTPMQIATAYSAIANGGLLVTPHVVNAVIDANGNRTPVSITPGRQVIKPTTAAEMRDMLTAVVVHNHKRAGVEGFMIGGKTGTAQVPDPNGPGYIADAYNHSFAGILPSNDPRFVMLVKIDQPNIAKVGQFAESTAVPLFGRLASFLLHYYQVPPTSLKP